jgi:hypothetical protein
MRTGFCYTKPGLADEQNITFCKTFPFVMLVIQMPSVVQKR